MRYRYRTATKWAGRTDKSRVLIYFFAVQNVAAVNGVRGTPQEWEKHPFYHYLR